MGKSNLKKNENVIWVFFSSVKLTIVLLIILATASILGTLIPQMPQRESIEFARGLSPGVFKFFNLLNLFDMYHSLWFRLLIALLALNLLICSIDRFPGTWKRFLTRASPHRSKPFQNLPPGQALRTSQSLKDTANRVAQLLESRYKKIQRSDSPDSVYLLGEKGRYSHFGVYLVHLSVLIILMGGLFGSFLGFDGYVNIVEGERIDRVTVRNGSVPLELGFEVRCDRFFVDFYKNGAPKEYRSDLTFFVNGKEVKKASLLVNHPIQFEGITFYQSSYGTVPGQRIRLRIVRQASKNEHTTLEAKVGSSFDLPYNEGKFQLVDVKADFMRMGPAVLILVQPKEGEAIRFWVFQNHQMISKQFPGLTERFPKLNPSAFKPYTFILEELESKFYTGLQVSRNPGVSIVWVGCFLMVGGFMVTFFMSHRRIWVRVLSEKDGRVIHIAGTASKNPVGLERELEHLSNKLKELFNLRE